MSRWLQIALEAEKSSSSSTYTLQEPAKRSEPNDSGDFLQVIAGCREDNSEKVQRAASPNPSVQSDMRHGLTIGGRPLTYTGRVVSLEDWRNLSDWEKHGPDGRVWNGKTQAWELPK